MVGRPYLVQANQKLVGSGSKTWLLNSMTFPVKAKVTKFWAYFVSDGKIHFEVWRRVPEDASGTLLQLIGRKTYTPTSYPDFHEVAIMKPSIMYYYPKF